MTFPTVATTLDNFNRADDASAPSTGWSNVPFSSSTNSFVVSSNTFAPQVNFWNNESYYSASTYGPDCEAYVQLPTLPADFKASRIFARLQQPGNGTGDAYMFEIYHRSDQTDDAKLYRVDNGSLTQIGSNATYEMSVGFWFGIGCVGSTITGYAGTSTASMSSVVSTTDSTYSSAGYMGVATTNENTSRWDNFSGGTISSGGGGTTYNKTLTATITFTASTVRQVGINRSSTVTFTASTRRAIGKALSATITFTPSTAYLKAILKSLSATVTFTAQATRRVGKNLSGTVTFTPSVVRRINKTLSQTITFTPSVAKVIPKALSATVTFTASLVQTYVPYVPAALANSVTGFSRRVASYLGHSVRAASYIGHSVRDIIYLGYSRRKKD